MFHYFWVKYLDPLPGIPPDLGQTETELLEKAFGAIANLTSPLPTTPVPVARESQIAPGAAKQPTIPHDGEGYRRAVDGRRQQDKETQQNGSNRGGNVDGVLQPSPLRISAGEIIRVLRAGAINDLRRASPALSAACIHRELAEGLEGAAAKREPGGSSTREDQHFGCSSSSSGRKGGRKRDSTDCDGRGWGVSKEEFCDYFEAVTDLVDLNGLNLVPRVHSSLVRPSAVSA